jgi:adenine phosphoribosyltransferase
LDTRAYIQSHVRTVPNWPQAGVMFRDITPLLSNKKVLRILIDEFVHRYYDTPLDKIAGVDARGFILGSVIAYELNLGFIPVRKKGKLPFKTLSEKYQLEYGEASIEIHADACEPGERVLLVDDLLATGGTLAAATTLLRRLDAHIVEAAVIIDLPELGGTKKLAALDVPVFSICDFSGH